MAQRAGERNAVIGVALHLMPALDWAILAVVWVAGLGAMIVLAAVLQPND